MSIRSTAKALIVNDGKVLLNKCRNEKYGDYYSLPGGGQHQYEALHDALIRECLEETGYTVVPVRFAALCEDISMSEEVRENHPDYAHRMYHIFICELAEVARKEPTETDDMQVSSEWIPIVSLKQARTLPKVLGENIDKVLDGTAPLFLGSEYMDFNHS